MLTWILLIILLWLDLNWRGKLMQKEAVQCPKKLLNALTLLWFICWRIHTWPVGLLFVKLDCWCQTSDACIFPHGKSHFHGRKWQGKCKLVYPLIYYPSGTLGCFAVLLVVGLFHGMVRWICEQVISVQYHSCFASIQMAKCIWCNVLISVEIMHRLCSRTYERCLWSIGLVAFTTLLCIVLF
jgi:hypothetical protein